MKFTKIAFGWGPGHIIHGTLEGPWPHYMILEVPWKQPLDAFFWALTVYWSRLLAHGWSGPILVATSLCHLADLWTAFLCKFQPSSATPQSFRGLQVFLSSKLLPTTTVGRKVPRIPKHSPYLNLPPSEFCLVFFCVRFVQWPRAIVYIWGPKQKEEKNGFRYMGVVWLVFHVLPHLLIRFASQWNLCCRISKIDDRALAKKQPDWELDFLWFGHGYRKCMFVGFLIEHRDPSF